MSNISSAFGDITIEVVAENAEKETELINKFRDYVNKTLGKVCYWTSIDLIDIINEGDADFGSHVYGKGVFTGCGRWSYEANVNQFYDWLKDEAEDNAEYNHFPSDEIKALWAELNQYKWRVSFDYTDEEGGNLVLYTEVQEIIHEANANTAEVNKLEEENYEYTPENLVDLGVYEYIEDAREACGVYEDEEDY